MLAEFSLVTPLLNSLLYINFLKQQQKKIDIRKVSKIDTIWMLYNEN